MLYLKEILFLFIQILICGSCFAQNKNIDSLKKKLPSLKDSAKVDCLNALAEAYIVESSNVWNWAPTITRVDSASFFLNEAVKLAEISNYAKGEAKAYYNLGRIGLITLTDLRLLEHYLRKALESASRLPDENFLGQVSHRLGTCLWFQSKFPDAMEYLEKAVQLFKKTGDKKCLAQTYYTMSVVDWQSGYYERSFQHAVLSAEILKPENMSNFAYIFKAMGDNETALELYRKDVQGNSMFMMAEIFLALQQYDSARLYYSAFKKMIRPDDQTHMSKFYSGLGELYSSLNNYDSALAYLEKALNWQRKVNDGNEILKSLLRLANTYYKQKNFIKAKKTSTEFLNMATSSGTRQYLPQAHYLLYCIYNSLRQKDSAFYHLQQYVLAKEVMDKDFSAYKLSFYKSKTERELAQSRIDLLNKESQIQQAKLEQTLQQRKFLFAGIAALVLISIVIFRIIILKRRNEKQRLEHELQLQKLESERTNSELQQQATELEMQALRAQMNPHFIFNSLNSINRFILQNNRLQASEYLTKFSKLVRMILQNSQASLITLESELEALGLYLEMETLRFNYHFDYKISIPKDLDIEVLKVPPLIIQPYVENAIWHGLMHKEEKGQLDIEVSEEDGNLYFKITDNGIGRKQAAELASKSATKHKPMGLHITAQRIAMMQSSNGIESPVKINDLVNPDGSAAGTEVIIKMTVIYD